jgi:phage shock protein PspC (stress-responsive transcriptional regulator)
MMETQQNHVALPMRSHTILGVCEAIGEDFGFNPVLLRIPFAAGVLWSPVAMVVIYFALGLVVLTSRLMFPRAVADGVSTTVSVNAANEQTELAKAA